MRPLGQNVKILTKPPIGSSAPKLDAFPGEKTQEEEENKPNKRKRNTRLKKLIIAEREVRKDAIIGDGSGTNGAALATTSGALQGPVAEFVPFVTVGAAATPAATGDGAALGASIAAGSSTGANTENGTLGGSFVPSWCRVQVNDGTGTALPSAVTSEGQGGATTAFDGTSVAAPASEELPVTEAMQRLLRGQRQGAEKGSNKKKQEKTASTAPELVVRHYVHQVLSDDMDEKVKFVLSKLVQFQDRAKEKDPAKFAKNKRYCVGMREGSRAIAKGKARCLILAPNLEVCTGEGGLDDQIDNLVELCHEHDVPVIFALSRNRIGKALGRNVRQSVVTVLSAEGVHQEFKAMIKYAEELRRIWVMQRMTQCDGMMPQPTRLPKGALGEIEVSEVRMSDLEDAAGITSGEDLPDAENDAVKVQRRDEELLAMERVFASQRAAVAAEKEATRQAFIEKLESERKAKQEEIRAAQRMEKLAKKRETKALKAAQKREKEEAKRLEKEAEEEEQRLIQEKKDREAREEEEIRRAADEVRRKKVAEMQALAAKEAARLAAEEEARQAELEAQSDSSDASSELPAGFNADMF
eukprot:TRINITY_DN73347_c0_g1_i1.p1 TRINITY_DN73347_c0_g1~~TRINITY_DN73347_c0_g1_i1.p1  ORF type:complete len:584 (-),score=134.37 TRINITY_DN73347_c0_g1_i1:81-1832(-)